MKVLFLDFFDFCVLGMCINEHCKEKCLKSYGMKTVHDKDSARKELELENYDIFFVNVKFNNGFVIEIRKKYPDLKIILISDGFNLEGLVEYAPYIDGYYRKPLGDCLDKVIRSYQMESV
jgi:hypothetical protein